MRLFSHLLLGSLAFALAACSSDPESKKDVVPEVTQDIVEAVPEVEPQDLNQPDETLVPDVADVVETVEEVTPDVVETVEDVDTLTWEYPDPAIVNKNQAPAVVSAQDTYLADETFQYRCPDAIPGTRTKAIRWITETLWVGSDAGLFKYLPDTDSFELIPVTEGIEVVDIANKLTSNGLLLIASPEAILYFQPAGNLTGTLSLPEGAGQFTSVAVVGTDVYAGTTGLGAIKVILNDPADWLPAGSAGGMLTPAVRDIDFGPSNSVLFATDQGIEMLSGDEVSFKTAEAGLLADNDVRALQVDLASGTIYAATATGVAKIKGASATFMTAGIGNLPTDNFTDLALSGDLLVLGHQVGATVAEKPFGASAPFTRFDHYATQRFLPNTLVHAVTVDGDGNVWFATDAGVARREWVEHTFAEKETYHQEMLVKHFWRMDGFVASDAGLDHVDDYFKDVPWRVWDKDNDGLWTQMQIGAWCYAYAATGDEQYYEAARKAMNNMFMLVDLPAIDFEKAGLGRGFISRSLVREDEGSVFEDKIPQANWHPVEWKGDVYRWKDDTSSDEIDGHFYGFPLFYDLCAKTPEEKAEVASYAADVLDYIMDNGLLLIDLDGEKTTHGHWSPETAGSAGNGVDACMAAAKGKPNVFELVEWCADSYYGGGWLNSNEILGALLATYHMTGDQKYYDMYEILIQVHGYDNLAVPHAETLTVTNPSIMNHSDHELAMLAYMTVLRYEPNAERRAKWIEGFKFFFEYELLERNPLWAGFAALVMDVDATVMDQALVSLREIPFDRREWTVDHSHRKDGVPWPLDRFDDPQTENVYPYDENRVVWWNGNFHQLNDGGNGQNVSGPMAWLLPYWALRYAGVISE